MSENNVPSSNSDPEAQPGEFDFAKPVPESPRVKRRSLKPRPATALKAVSGIPPGAQQLAHEAPPVSPERARQEYVPSPLDDDDAEKNAEVKITEPEPARPTSTPKTSQPYVRPTTRPSASSQTTTSPHGTRPATLYYSSGTRKEKESPSPTPSPTPMKSTPAASSASTTPASSTSATTPARSTSATGSTTPRTAPVSVVDYRTNVERQSREQKSVGGILTILVYSLIGLFGLGATLAGYGGYVLSKQIHEQSMTVAELDRHYAQENLDMNAKLATTQETLSQAQAEIARQQDLIVKQQEMINKLLSAIQENSAAIRTERATRADETANLRARLKNLEYRAPGSGPTSGTTTTATGATIRYY